MDHKWIKGHEDEEARKREVLSYSRAFEDLSKVLEDWVEDGAPDYDCSSWSHKQADRNGANRMLQRVINLINIKDKG